MSLISQRLIDLGITLPEPSTPVAAYVPYVHYGHLVFISGQLPIDNGDVKFIGRVGSDIQMTAAQMAARLCALNILAQLHAACGGQLDRVERCIKLGGFVASAPDFFDQPQVMNGASELIEQIFGDAGKHARFAVGASNLPRNAAVEVDAIFALKQ
jgi:enamine deaminase RidA (YjgF/YER057c/UK114 family)